MRQLSRKVALFSTFRGSTITSIHGYTSKKVIIHITNEERYWIFIKISFLQIKLESKIKQTCQIGQGLEYNFKRRKQLDLPLVKAQVKPTAKPRAMVKIPSSI